jgi:hypothetical protein
MSLSLGDNVRDLELNGLILVAIQATSLFGGMVAHFFQDRSDLSNSVEINTLTKMWVAV